MRKSSEWFSYNSAADVYASVSVPLMFQRPAIDLLQLLKPRFDQKLLDVGAGTGAISSLANSYVRSVVAADLSTNMLHRAKGVKPVAARVPGLPFPKNSFDFVTAGFVLSHVQDYAAALLDIVRVLQPTGKVAIASWKVNQNRYSETWSRVSEEFGGKNFFEDVVSQVLPWEGWFAEPSNVKKALQEAGCSRITIEERDYAGSTTIDRYLASKRIGLQARYLQRKLAESKWVEFLGSVENQFRKDFTEPLEFSSSVIFGIGQKGEL